MVSVRKEITGQLQLEDREGHLLDNHSLLNLFNVLERQLEALSPDSAIPALKPYSAFCVDVLMTLSGPDFSKRFGEIEQRFRELARTVKVLMEQHPEQRKPLGDILETLAVAASRLGEFRKDRFEWQTIPCEAFHRNLSRFLAATEKVSHGRFHFIYAPAPNTENGYRIEFQIHAAGATLQAPPVLHDTIRDLVANARKYSHPGSDIYLRLGEEKPNGLRLRVVDEGIGIPEDEIEKVIQFGYRASNTTGRRTMGGGYGLTKAYQLCRKFDGRFFIDSAKDRGTAIEFTLFSPPPEEKEG